MYRREPRTGEKVSNASQGHVTPWGFCDVNYVEDSRNRKSTSGYMFMLAGGPIAWKSKKLMSVTLSTTEVEYYALGIACQEAVWIWQLFQELFVMFNDPIHIYSDNTGAVALSDNPIFHNKLKHINICWHFIRDLIRSKVIHTSHIPGMQNGAKFLTEALNHHEHEHCIALLGIE